MVFGPFYGNTPEAPGSDSSGYWWQVAWPSDWLPCSLRRQSNGYAIFFARSTCRDFPCQSGRPLGCFHGICRDNPTRQACSYRREPYMSAPYLYLPPYTHFFAEIRKMSRSSQSCLLSISAPHTEYLRLLN